jgi:serine/threonine-protein kinase
LIGPLVLVAVMGAVWLSRSPKLMNQPASVAAVSLPAAGPSSGSFENLPIEFGEYRLVRRLGKGGMATVYEAERRGERFALKRPLAGHLLDPRFRERFDREADLGRSLHHPNIIRIFDRGQVGEVPFFAMELIDGETLRDRLDRDGRLDPRLAAGITARVAEALDYAHHKGVVHRDLKPSNIMLERSGGVKVMDYGIARAQHLEGVTVTGGFVGTPQYAAPEAVDALTEPRSDLYSLGVVFFEMLTGSVPFRGENPLAVLQAQCAVAAPAPSSLNPAVPETLDRIVLQLLDKEPSARPTAEMLLNHLADYVEEGR